MSFCRLESLEKAWVFLTLAVTAVTSFLAVPMVSHADEGVPCFNLEVLRDYVTDGGDAPAQFVEVVSNHLETVTRSGLVQNSNRIRSFAATYLLGHVDHVRAESMGATQDRCKALTDLKVFDRVHWSPIGLLICDSRSDNLSIACINGKCMPRMTLQESEILYEWGNACRDNNDQEAAADTETRVSGTRRHNAPSGLLSSAPVHGADRTSPLVAQATDNSLSKSPDTRTGAHGVMSAIFMARDMNWKYHGPTGIKAILSIWPPPSPAWAEEIKKVRRANKVHDNAYCAGHSPTQMTYARVEGHYSKSTQSDKPYEVLAKYCLNKDGFPTLLAMSEVVRFSEDDAGVTRRAVVVAGERKSGLGKASRSTIVFAVQTKIQDGAYPALETLDTDTNPFIMKEPKNIGIPRALNTRDSAILVDTGGLLLVAIAATVTEQSLWPRVYVMFKGELYAVRYDVFNAEPKNGVPLLSVAFERKGQVLAEVLVSKGESPKIHEVNFPTPSGGSLFSLQ